LFNLHQSGSYSTIRNLAREPFTGRKNMDAMNAILSRRSIRKYTNQPVSDEVMKELLEAAMSAPSAGNEQPWHFVVIDDRKILDEIPRYHPYSQMLKDAPVAVMVCGDETLQKYEGYWVQDCSAATENILIAAQAKGLGAVWLGVYPIEDRVAALRKLLGIPENVIPFSLISIGYPAEQKPRSDRYDDSRIHHNQW
jgi:nitroreductase